MRIAFSSYQLKRVFKFSIYTKKLASMTHRIPPNRRVTFPFLAELYKFVKKLYVNWFFSVIINLKPIIRYLKLLFLLSFVLRFIISLGFLLMQSCNHICWFWEDRYMRVWLEVLECAPIDILTCHENVRSCLITSWP